ncbi:MAG: MFS transporter [Candidatus Korarchaeota archaeon]
MSDEKISFTKKLEYGVGSFGYLMSSSVASAWALRFFETKALLNAALLSLGYVIYGIWNFLNDPIFGIICDRTKTRWGRRIPYLRFGAPLLGLTFMILWFTPPPTDQGFLFLHFTFWICAYDTMYTIIGIAYLSLLPEITTDAVERAKTSSVAQAFGAVAGVAAYVVPYFLLGNIMNFQLLMVAIGLLAWFGMWITAFTIREHMEFATEKQPGLFESIKVTFTSKPFVLFVGMNFMVVFVTYSMVPSISYYIEYVLHMDPGTGVFLMGSIFVFALLGLPFVLKIQKKKGSKYAVFFSLVLMVIGLSMLFFAPSIEFVVIALSIVGFGISAPVLLINVLIADIVDHDELRTGVRREGMFFGTNALVTKPAISLGAIAVLQIHLATGFDPLAPEQTELALLGLKALVSLIPAVAIVIALLFLYFYPLDKKRVEEIKAKIDALHAVKREKYLSQKSE